MLLETAPDRESHQVLCENIQGAGQRLPALDETGLRRPASGSDLDEFESMGGNAENLAFDARLVAVDDRTVASGRHFTSTGELKPGSDVVVLDVIGHGVTRTKAPPYSFQRCADYVAGAIEALGLPREHPLPEGATAFEAQLTVGAPGHEANYVFWEGALEQDQPLNTLIRQLERL